MTELVAATVPNVDLGKGSEREGRSGEWPRAGKTKQRAEQTRRGRRADGGEGENGYKSGARETSVPIAKKNTLYLNKEQVRETRRQAHTWHNVARGVRESYAKARRILTNETNV